MICSIVVLYNPTRDEVKNINTYMDMVDYVFVMDNSKENHYKEVVKIFDEKDNGIKLKFFHFPENKGLCYAFNRGMKEAYELGCEWALLMDSDSFLLNNIIEIYKNYLEKFSTKKEAVLSPVHIFERSKLLAYDGFKECKWAMTSGCFYNINIFLRLNGFQEELFVDGLDIDYGYKVCQNGYKIIEVGKAKLKHFPGNTRVLTIGNREIFKYGWASSERYYMQARALIWIFLKYKSMRILGTYLYKWFKVLFLFDDKHEYIKKMKNGTCEGIKLWLKLRKVKNE